MGRLVTTLVVIAALAAAGWFGYQRFTDTQTAADEGPNYELAQVELGSINSTVSATGSIEPEAQVSLSFRTPGRIQQVLVATGQPVQEGQLLAQLDVTDLQLALEQAQIGLEISRAQLSKLEKPVDTDEIAAAEAGVRVAQASVTSAEASLNSAQAAYRQLLSGPTSDELAVQQVQVRQAEAALRQAQNLYDQVKDLPQVGALPQAANLEQATIAYEVAIAQFQLLQNDANEAQIAASLAQIAGAELSVQQARSNLLTAQNRLDQLLEGPSEEDLTIARAQVRQAELSLKQTQITLDNARLTAPIDGVVSLVNVRQGELYSGGLPAIVLTDLDSFHMTVLVDEIDVRQVQVGQRVRLSLDALPDADISGLVTKVSPTARDVGGVVAYEVDIVPSQSDAALRAGMSATAIITTAQVDNVVLVPNRYIQLDRESGRAFVQKMVGGEPVLQEIELGLRNDRFSQVLAGLSSEDEIALIRTSSQEQLRNTLFGN